SVYEEASTIQKECGTAAPAITKSAGGPARAASDRTAEYSNRGVMERHAPGTAATSRSISVTRSAIAADYLVRYIERVVLPDIEKANSAPATWCGTGIPGYGIA